MSLELYITAMLVAEFFLWVAAHWLLSRAGQMYVVYGDTDRLGDNYPRVQHRLWAAFGIVIIMLLLAGITIASTPEALKYWLGWFGVIWSVMNLFMVAFMVFGWQELDELFSKR